MLFDTSSVSIGMLPIVALHGLTITRKAFAMLYYRTAFGLESARTRKVRELGPIWQLVHHLLEYQNIKLAAAMEMPEPPWVA